jgi:hypothetical protein
VCGWIGTSSEFGRLFLFIDSSFGGAGGKNSCSLSGVITLGDSWARIRSDIGGTSENVEERREFTTKGRESDSSSCSSVELMFPIIKDETSITASQSFLN